MYYAYTEDKVVRDLVDYYGYTEEEAREIFHRFDEDGDGEWDWDREIPSFYDWYYAWNEEEVISDLQWYYGYSEEEA